MSKLLEELSKHHNEWLKIASAFVSKEVAKDVVQDMYVTLDRYNVTLDAILKNGKLQKGFCYVTIRNLSKAYYNKNINFYPLEYVKLSEESHREYEEALDKMFNKIYDEVESWENYDKTLFEAYMHTGLSFRDLAHGTKKENVKMISKSKVINEKSLKRGSGISVSSIFNTVKGCKEILKDKFHEDYEDFLNNDFELI
jgi:hypothetical protein